MARRKSFRSQLYRAARDLGNVEAVEHGGIEGGAKRYARRAVYRGGPTASPGASCGRWGCQAGGGDSHTLDTACA
jgi:hypothetical protein